MSSEQVRAVGWSQGGPCTVRYGEKGLGTFLYSQVQCIMSNGHMDPGQNDEQTRLKKITFLQIHW